MKARLTAPLMLLLLSAMPALAQDDTTQLPEAWASMAGDWSVEGEDTATFQCTITLSGEAGIGGFGLAVPESCQDTWPTSDFAAWYIDETNNSVVFVDALRETVLRFGEAGDGGIFATSIDSPPQYYLVRPSEGDE